VTASVIGSGALVEATSANMYAGPWFTVFRRSKLAIMLAASNGVPSENFTPDRSLNV
jgi:hypothetical protein